MAEVDLRSSEAPSILTSFDPTMVPTMPQILSEAAQRWTAAIDQVYAERVRQALQRQEQRMR